MKVYVVLFDGPDGALFRSVWATKDAAETEAKRLDAPTGYPNHYDHFVEEVEVQP